MALTDADRLQIVSMALMRNSVIQTGGGDELGSLIWTIKDFAYIPTVFFAEVGV